MRVLALPLAAALLAAVVAGGCFKARNETVQVESLGYLQFSGHTQGAVATASRGETVVLNALPLPEKRTSYTIRPGTYLVVVERGGAVVVRRQIYVADGTTVEVRVP
jgi:hypothetical protein